MNYRIEVVAIDCLMLRLFDAIAESHMPWLLAASERLRGRFGPALVDLVPSYTTLMLQFDLEVLSPAEARQLIAASLDNLQPAPQGSGRLQPIAVWYDASVGPELPLLAAKAGISEGEVIRRHCARDYQVFALGFAPGFAFMGLVEEALAAPRLPTPRKRVAAGSVGIAERQTAVYPAASPGGWNLLGRSAVALFDPDTGRSLLQPGDRVRFVAVSHDEFIQQGGDDTPLAAL
ncbi:5-oxoprolinase subunit B family protein [Pseudomonas sp. 5P_3.1_Bac2]|uniref:5-oxoprolinase subunit B family protein n=1 Tax=Pseudomonas sp. 5P_3.1_Bac2 TaxID=2971617 RepID=UPI0021C5B397|nr:allophanate hydrolase subunit 1 [Pseudomonas sp. 5P_3.1_Bac2]MCU1716274.1 allophanate hydrolase subunit 1 [Pseudomonas sp. 5P_3.1_Bac2]